MRSTAGKDGKMTVNSDVDEGDPCPTDGCEGKMYYPPQRTAHAFKMRHVDHVWM